MTDLPEPDAPRLRVGAVVHSTIQPAWVARVLRDIRASPIADIALIIEVAPDPPRPIRPSQALYTLYTAADRRLFGSVSASGPLVRPPGERDIPDAFAKEDVSDLIAGVDRVGLDAVADAASVRRYDLDVLLLFPTVPPATLSPTLARWGVWTIRFGDDEHEGKPAGFWEVMGGAPVSSAALQLDLPGVDAPVIPYRAIASTDPYSVTRNLSNLCWTSSAFVLRLLTEIHGRSGPAPADLARADVPVPLSGRPREVPGNLEMGGLLVRHAARLVADRVTQRLAPARWELAYHVGADLVPLHRFQPLVPPGPRYWADPFPVRRDDRTYLFFEEVDSIAEPGHISVMQLGADGRWSEPVTVLRTPYHLSYPDVFEWEGTFYMIPETHQARRVELYRCTDFPYAWELDRVLLDGIAAVDTTIAEVDGRWWMFFASGEDGVRNYEELHVYSASAPTGPWRPHRRNPVKSDTRTARPAGRLFHWHGRLLRPSQDSGGRYGRAVVVNEILRIDDDRFDERPVGRIEPHWHPDVQRVHTFNVVSGLAVVDCLRRDLRVQPSRRRVPGATGRA